MSRSLNIYIGADERKSCWRKGTPLEQGGHEEMKGLQEFMKDCILSQCNTVILQQGSVSFLQVEMLGIKKKKGFCFLKREETI